MSRTSKITLHTVVLLLLLAGGVVFNTTFLQEKSAADNEEPTSTLLLHNEPLSKTSVAIQPKDNSQDVSGTPLPSPLEKIHHRVPFTSQAPSAQWDDLVFQDGCEEASVIMGMHWVEGDKRISKGKAEEEIRALANAANQQFGASLDLSASDTTTLIRTYYKHDNIRLHTNVTADHIIEALYRNSTVIIPVNGKKLFNPYFVEGGPDNHMLIVTGYDPKKDEFITNDPGTRRGEDFKYSKNVLNNALRDYPTGFHEPNTDPQTAMIELWR